jgi:hypothetical protein
MPDGVLGIWVAVPGCPREQAALEVEGEQVITGPWSRDVKGSLGDEQFGQRTAEGRIVYSMNAAGAVEGVLVVRAGKGVQGKPAVPVEVSLLGPGHDERVHSAPVDQWAHGVQPRPAVTADCGQEGQAHSELVQQGPPRHCEFRLIVPEFIPRGHGASLLTIEIHVNEPGASLTVAPAGSGATR